MSIFGNIAKDVADIPDDPFFIKPNTYWALCTESVMKVSQEGGTQLLITWTIDEPDNDYHHKSRTEYFDLFPERESWDEYTPEEKQKTIWLNRRLRRAFDLSESEVATVECSDLMGKGAFITLKESEGKEGTKNAGKKFINIFDAISKRLYEEEKGESTSAAASLGLGSGL